MQVRLSGEYQLSKKLWKDEYFSFRARSAYLGQGTEFLAGSKGRVLGGFLGQSTKPSERIYSRYKIAVNSERLSFRASEIWMQGKQALADTNNPR